MTVIAGCVDVVSITCFHDWLQFYSVSRTWWLYLLFV